MISTIVLLSPTGALQQGRNAFTVEFRSANGSLIDVGAVRSSANMTMPGMAMSGGVQVSRTTVPGRYQATAEFGMAGAWKMAIEWNGPAAHGSVELRRASAMTKRFWIVTACGLLTWSVNVRAQSGAQNPRSRSRLSTSTRKRASRSLKPSRGRWRRSRSLARHAPKSTSSGAMQLQSGAHPNPMVSFMQQMEPGGTDSQTRIELQWPLDLFRKTGRSARGRSGSSTPPSGRSPTASVCWRPTSA